MIRTSPLLALALTLAACAGDRDAYPTLSRRPAERIAATPPTPAPIATPALPDNELLARIEELVGQARKADDAFRAQVDRTRQLVLAAQGSMVASEAWSVATVALADLESSRSNAMVVLAELDAIYAARTIAGEDLAAITRARSQVIELVGAEDALLADLHGRMAS